LSPSIRVRLPSLHIDPESVSTFGKSFRFGALSAEYNFAVTLKYFHARAVAASRKRQRKISVAMTMEWFEIDEAI
jgi:hypothetical protein